MFDIKGYQIAVGAAVGLLASLGYQVASPGQQMETHRVEHVQLETTLKDMQSDLSDIGVNLRMLVRIRCLEMDTRDLALSGIDCSLIE